MHGISLTDYAKLTAGVVVGRSGPATDWPPSEGVPCLSSYDSWERLSAPETFI